MVLLKGDRGEPAGKSDVQYSIGKYVKGGLYPYTINPKFCSTPPLHGGVAKKRERAGNSACQLGPC